MFRRFRAVALWLGVVVALVMVCVTSVAEARAPKRLALGQLDNVTAEWSITVTDCPYCLGGGQVDVSNGSATSRGGLQVDVTDTRGRRVDTYGHPLPAAGFLRLAGGRPNLDPVPQCAGPDLQPDVINEPSHRYEVDIRFARVGDQLELVWQLPSCDSQIDGTPAQAAPARTSIPLSALKQRRYSIRFLGTVPFDIPDPSQPDEPHWVGTISYDATLSFAHRCIRQGNGTRFCV